MRSLFLIHNLDCFWTMCRGLFTDLLLSRRRSLHARAVLAVATPFLVVPFPPIFLGTVAAVDRGSFDVRSAFRGVVGVLGQPNVANDASGAWHRRCAPPLLCAVLAVATPLLVEAEKASEMLPGTVAAGVARVGERHEVRVRRAFQGVGGVLGQHNLAIIAGGHSADLCLPAPLSF